MLQLCQVTQCVAIALGDGPAMRDCFLGNGLLSSVAAPVKKEISRRAIFAGARLRWVGADRPKRFLLNFDQAGANGGGCQADRRIRAEFARDPLAVAVDGTFRNMQEFGVGRVGVAGDEQFENGNLASG